MPPKGKGKKGRKQDEEDFWAKAGESVPQSNTTNPKASEVSDSEAAPSRSGFSNFAALGIDGLNAEDEEEDFGGLMSAIKASAKNAKKDKKKAKKTGTTDVSFADGPPPGEGSDGEAAAAKGDISVPKKPIEMTPDDLADEEWGPSEKGKKKKGKKDKKTPDESSAPVDASEPSDKNPTAPAAPEDDDEEADGGTKILSKKEKEKRKKEREKAKKKAQAQAKKADAEQNDGAAEAPAAAAAPGISTPPPAAPAEEEEEEEPGAATDPKKKKKKKKPAKKEDEVPKPATKKGGAAVAALKAMMEQQRLAAEEARRREEEERLRIEEEERRLAEEERLREEAKQRKKEKEKAKRELAKKEGRLLTDKQKKEKAAAEIRRQALIQSGASIAGLQAAPQPTGGPPKKINYGSRKRKPTPGQSASTADNVSVASPISTPAELEVESAAGKEDEVKSDWDASEPEPEEPAKPVQADVKDDWDATSEEEEASPAPPVPTPAAKSNGASNLPSKPQPKPVTSSKTSTPAQAPTTKSTAGAAPPAKPSPAPTKAAPAPAPAEESEEESEEESDEDDEDETEESESEDDGMTAAQRQAAQRKAEAAERRAKRHEEALAARSKDNLRSPICCILGHVDTGKTKLLDKIRQTNVQEGEAGGITQQIGATYFPVEAIKQKTLVMNKDGKQEYKIPGLLIIDTPGHESFTNLRSRGSSLCNIAVLVVDIMHGLEPQTLESLRLLRDRKTPFIVALNKIDRLYGWEATPDGAFQESFAKQKASVQREFADRSQRIMVAFAEQGLNAVLYFENKDFRRNVSIVPTSAITGEGVPDMIQLLVTLTQTRMSDALMYLSELECTVLEVKVIEGLGTTIDVVLSNGILREGDKIVVCGLNGPIVTQVRALLTPQPLRELRIKSAYVHHKEVKAALGVKITAPDLEKAIAGSRLLVCGPDDDEDDLREEVMSDLATLLNSIDKSGRGVCVQASTLGSLEALLEFLKQSKIPVSGINIGPVHKKDVMRAATMLEKAKELACILCFDVTVDKDAERIAEELGIRLFKADIIYHLFDAFTAYNAEIVEAKRRDAAPQAIWPCRLRIIQAFAKRDPIILGVDILDGTLRVGTPLCAIKTDPATQKREIVPLGKITSLEINHKSMELVKKSQAGAGVAVKIEHAVYQSAKMFGRHFDEKDDIVSHITRQSIDVLKESFKKDVSLEEWQLIKALKPRLGIP